MKVQTWRPSNTNLCLPVRPPARLWKGGCNGCALLSGSTYMLSLWPPFGAAVVARLPSKQSARPVIPQTIAIQLIRAIMDGQHFSW